ncbi:Radical SAM superfamily enzyme YgiQ, UPF0313 family [Desulfonatronum zhilinae]|nr:Radical SAM superfamily enzyme YgiQ, UPF0313 family [Desulfonatronum zhilinae]
MKKKLYLIQPNYALLGKRSWPLAPYNLALLKACVSEMWDCHLLDFNKDLSTENDIVNTLEASKPDVIGLTSFSTEYNEEIHRHAAIIKNARPNSILIGGGAYPTVTPEVAAQDPNVDFWIIGEGEHRLPELLRCIECNKDPEHLDGIVYRKGNQTVINPMESFISDLDSLPRPDYGDLDLVGYGASPIKYAHYLVARQYPFAVTVTSRGCPYKCIFCAGRTVSGTKVRMRSAQNVLDEVDWLKNSYGIREIIFLDDHFFFNKERAIAIMNGFKEHHSLMTWKCANVAIFSLNENILDIKRDSGCYQITVSIESGNQDVLSKIMRKPINLKHAKRMITHAKSIGLEIISNFVIGLPGETWEQIRQTFAFAAELDIDIVNFHIATPLPKTRLMDIYREMGLVDRETATLGYTKGVIQTDEFTSLDLQILRAYEWDRINFKSQDKVQRIADLEGISVDDVKHWRINTRRALGSTLGWTHTPKPKPGSISTS